MVKTLQVKDFNEVSDIGRLCELWANLCMIQQMNGGSYWMSEYEASKLPTWADFMKKMSKAKESYILVFHLDNVLFGFSYVHIMRSTNKSIIREFYIEPGYLQQIEAQDLGNKVHTMVGNRGPIELEFAVKDIPFE